MAYIGQSIKNGTFSVLDTSGNTYNSSNTTFNLGTQVGSPAQLLVSKNGVIQKAGTDYTLASGGTQITFTTAPASGASIFIVEISGAVGGPMNRDINGDELILDVDGDTSITADTDDQIDVKIGGTDQFSIKDGVIEPTTDNDVDIGSSSKEFKDGYFDGTLHCDTLNLAGTAHTSITSGLTEMDSWRITSDFTGNQTPISSNWERVDSYNWSKLGTGLSQSSGVFSFPSTGFWLIIARYQIVNSTTSNYQAGIALQVTNDNSSYNTAIDAPSHADNGYVQSHTMAYVFDVDNTTNDKFRLSFGTSDSNTVVQGDSNKTMTGFTIIKISET